MNPLFSEGGRRAGRARAHNLIRRFLEAPPQRWPEMGPDVVAVPPWLDPIMEALEAMREAARLEGERLAREGRARLRRRVSIERYSDLGFAGDPLPTSEYVDYLDWAGNLIRRSPRPPLGASHAALEAASDLGIPDDAFAAALGISLSEWQRQFVDAYLRAAGAHL